ncbi:RTA1 domain protein [Apiospora arundinis]|uniref:RTA1 domain protein n=1 Tax=Apiospora arundinis TaxID=335852 RepID=A0ABR2I9S1_9PEZI
MAYGDPVLYSLYIYKPNQVALIVFAALYALSAICHTWQCHRYKAWRVVGVHPICGVLFIIGYATRAWVAYGTNYLYDEDNAASLGIFIISQVFIYCAPPLLELGNYHILARLFYYVPYLAVVPGRRIMVIFGGIMLVVEGLNGIGAALGTNPKITNTAIGTGIMLTANAVQVAVILTFLVLAGLFHYRCETRGSRTGMLHPQIRRGIRKIMLTLYVSMLLILVRCIYRLVEHTGDNHIEYDNVEAMKKVHPFLRYEHWFLIFEAGLMLINSGLWNVFHPGRFLPRNVQIYIARDGTEVEVQRPFDDREGWQKVLHVLTLCVAYRKADGSPLPSRKERAGLVKAPPLDSGYDSVRQPPMAYEEGTPHNKYYANGSRENGGGHGEGRRKSEAKSSSPVEIVLNVLTLGLYGALASPSSKQKNRRPGSFQELGEYPRTDRYDSHERLRVPSQH